jgi:coatomer protein complex subunit gamma
VVNRILPKHACVLDSLVTGESILKYSSLKVLSRLASKNPKQVALASSEIEPLITDSNTSIASMAISTLLKTCTEGYVQKLLAQISHYLPDLGDDFKIEVIHSVYLLFLRVPSKSTEQISFLLKCLTGEGTGAYKESIVETMMKIELEGSLADKEQVLLALCEFIEDWEFQHLQTHILDFIAKESHDTTNPSVYIRFIFNRIVLENAVIRAAAVSSLGTMGYKIKQLREQIVILLKNCLNDDDDEVRERVLFYVGLLNYPPEDEDEHFEEKNFVFDQLNLDYGKLEQYLVDNQDTILDNEDEEIFDLDSFYTEVDESALTRNIQKDSEIKHDVEMDEKKINIDEMKEEEKGEDPLASIHTEIMSLNRFVLDTLEIEKPDFSSESKEVTDASDELYVHVMKHFSNGNIIFQFEVQNNIEENKLSNITVDLESPKASYTILHKLKSEDAKYPVIVLKPNDESVRFITGEFKFKLKYTVTEVDDEGNEEGNYEDEYPLDNVVITVKDYISKQNLPSGKFMEAWDMLKKKPSCTETMETFQIKFNTMKEAVDGVIKFFGMSICEDSDKVEEGEKVHNIFLAGTFYSMYPVLIRGQIGFNSQYGCVLRVGIIIMRFFLLKCLKIRIAKYLKLIIWV